MLDRAYRELATGLERRAESHEAGLGPGAGAGLFTGGPVALPPPLDPEAATPGRLLFDTRPLGQLHAFTGPEKPSRQTDGPAFAVPLPPAVPEAVVPPAVAEAPEVPGEPPAIVALPPKRPDASPAVSAESSASSPEATAAVEPREKVRPRKAPRRRAPTPAPAAKREATSAPTQPPPPEATSPPSDSALQRASRSFTEGLTCMFTPGCAARRQAEESATGAVAQPPHPDRGSKPARK